MKKIQLWIAWIITMALMLIPGTAMAAPTATSTASVPASETVTIDGTDYLYTYDHSTPVHTVTIQDVTTKTTDVMTYNTVTGDLDLNGNAFGHIDSSDTIKEASPAGLNGWVVLDSGTARVSWAYGAAISVVAAAIAEAIDGPVGGVISAMGNALADWASSYSGASVTYTLRMFSQIFVNPSYEWSWKLSQGGKTSGPYYYVSSSLPGDPSTEVGPSTDK